MAAARHYYQSVAREGTDSSSTRAQLERVLLGIGLNPSNYILSPVSAEHTSQGVYSSHISAFSNYPSQQAARNQDFVRPQTKSLLTLGRPLSNVQQPPPPPLPQTNQDSFNPQPPQNQQTSSPPSQPSGLSLFGSLFKPSASNPPNPPTNNQQSDSSPPQPSGLSALGALFKPPAPNPPAANPQTSSIPTFQNPPAENPTNLVNSSLSNTQNSYPQPPPDMSSHCYSPHREPSPLPAHLSSCLRESDMSAEHYLREINSRDVPPVKIVKPCSQNFVYKKEIRIRYLQPPTPPPPAPIVIREKRIPPPPPESPLLIRERKPEARTPPPLTIRERPPTPPPRLEPYVIEKSIPPPPPQPRQIIVERLPTPPPKPRTVIFEKWLPYKRLKRPVLLQKAPPPPLIKPARNVIIEYEPCRAHTVRRVIEEGVFRVDPHNYSLQSTHSTDGGEVRMVERIEDLPPPSEQLAHVLSEYRHGGSSHSYDYDCHSTHHLSEHVSPSIQNLLSGGHSTSHLDHLRSVSRASSIPAYRTERVQSAVAASDSSSTTPTVVPLQKSGSKVSRGRIATYTPNDSTLQSHINGLY